MKEYYYLSFAGDSGWLGFSIVLAESFPDAIREAHVQGCNPGGEVKGHPLDNIEGLPYKPNQFYTRKDMEALGDEAIRWQTE